MNRTLMLMIGAALAAQANADPAFTLSSPGTALAGYVTGEAVPIRVSAPSSALLSRSTPKLNGVDVSSALAADGAGSMSGMVAGLQAGANVFELWSRNS